MLSKLHRNGKGFTLIELMIVIAIIAILAAIAIPNFMAARRKARISADKQQLASYATALEVYAADESLGDGSYPAASGIVNLVAALNKVTADGSVAMRNAKAKDLGDKKGGDGLCIGDEMLNASAANVFTLCIESIDTGGTAKVYTWTSAGGAGW